MRSLVIFHNSLHNHHSRYHSTGAIKHVDGSKQLWTICICHHDSGSLRFDDLYCFPFKMIIITLSVCWRSTLPCRTTHATALYRAAPHIYAITPSHSNTLHYTSYHILTCFTTHFLTLYQAFPHMPSHSTSITTHFIYIYHTLPNYSTHAITL